MKLHEIIKLICEAEKKNEDYVYIRIYSDGSGGLYNEIDEVILIWNKEKEIRSNIKSWLKE